VKYGARRAARSPQRGPLADAVARPEIDRSSLAQHRQLARARGFVDTARDDELARARGEQRQRDAQRLAALYDRPLPEFARAFVNECFAEADAAADAALLCESVPDEARTRAAQLYARRLPLSATLRDVVELDPRQGTLPIHDTSALALLRTAELPPRVRAAQREALQVRFLRQPHRSRYPFLHDVIAGWFLHVLEGGGDVKPRRELRVADVAHHQLAAYFVTELGRTMNRSAVEVAALSFADNAFIDRTLSQPVRELLLVSAELSFRLEPLVVHGWGESPQRLLGDVLLFFAIPSLERLSAARGARSVALCFDAACLVEGSFEDALRSGDAPDPNELDVARMLGGLVDELWRDPRCDLPLFDLLPLATGGPTPARM
jgi:hypothetical protein